MEYDEKCVRDRRKLYLKILLKMEKSLIPWLYCLVWPFVAFFGHMCLKELWLISHFLAVLNPKSFAQYWSLNIGLSPIKSTWFKMTKILILHLPRNFRWTSNLSTISQWPVGKGWNCQLPFISHLSPTTLKKCHFFLL